MSCRGHRIQESGGSAVGVHSVTAIGVGRRQISGVGVVAQEGEESPESAPDRTQHPLAPFRRGDRCGGCAEGAGLREEGAWGASPPASDPDPSADFNLPAVSELEPSWWRGVECWRILARLALGDPFSCNEKELVGADASSGLGYLMDRHDKLLGAVQSLSEKELTTKLLIPLFKALGFARVEYSGGPTEEGKDIICWRRDELDEVDLAVAQVKKFKLTRPADHSRSLQTILNQLSQASEKPLPHPETQGQHLPTVIYLITPFPLETLVLQSKFELLPSLRRSRIKLSMAIN